MQRGRALGRPVSIELKIYYEFLKNFWVYIVGRRMKKILSVKLDLGEYLENQEEDF